MYSVYEQEINKEMEYSEGQIIAKTNYLSDLEKKEIDKEFYHYEHIDSVALEALRIVQKHRGWISDNSLQAISQYIKISIAQLESVATCYQLIFRQPVGKMVIYLCNSASCWIMGCESIKYKLQSKLKVNLGEISADGLFTLLQSPCLGDCDKAPVVMINESMHYNLTPQKIEKIVNSYTANKSGT